LLRAAPVSFGGNGMAAWKNGTDATAAGTEQALQRVGLDRPPREAAERASAKVKVQLPLRRCSARHTYEAECLIAYDTFRTVRDSP
jgi:hypothetical protein